jgi:hypothetical protein
MVRALPSGASSVMGYGDGIHNQERSRQESPNATTTSLYATVLNASCLFSICYANYLVVLLIYYCMICKDTVILVLLLYCKLGNILGACRFWLFLFCSRSTGLCNKTHTCMNKYFHGWSPLLRLYIICTYNLDD